MSQESEDILKLRQKAAIAHLQTHIAAYGVIHKTIKELDKLIQKENPAFYKDLILSLAKFLESTNLPQIEEDLNMYEEIDEDIDDE